MKIATLKNGALAQGVMNPTATIVDVGVMQKGLLDILTLQIEEINRLWVSTMSSSKPHLYFIYEYKGDSVDRY